MVSIGVLETALRTAADASGLKVTVWSTRGLSEAMAYWRETILLNVAIGVVHANVGQNYLKRNILSNFKTDRSKTCTLLFGDASHFSY